MEVAGAIRAMGLSVPLVLTDEADDKGLSVLFPLYQHNSSQTRFRILPCALHRLLMEPPRWANRRGENDVNIFEYHAPVKKRYDA